MVLNNKMVTIGTIYIRNDWVSLYAVTKGTHIAPETCCGRSQLPWHGRGACSGQYCKADFEGRHICLKRHGIQHLDTQMQHDESHWRSPSTSHDPQMLQNIFPRMHQRVACRDTREMNSKILSRVYFSMWQSQVLQQAHTLLVQNARWKHQRTHTISGDIQPPKESCKAWGRSKWYNTTQGCIPMHIKQGFASFNEVLHYHKK